MPTRAHRPTPVRTHSRSSSGGSSKVVLNLQLTQKDPVLPKIDKARRTSHPLEVRHCFPSITPQHIRTRTDPRGLAHVISSLSPSPFGSPSDVHRFPFSEQPPTRTNILRTGSTVRVQSREHVPSAAPRRAATNPLPSRGSGKPKAGFTIAASTVGSDEDEWESSESGAATPLDDVSGDEGSGKKTPQEQQSPSTPVDPTAGQRGGNGQQNAAAFVPSTTPRAEPTQAQARPRVQTNGFTVRQPPPVAAPAARIPSPPKPPQQQQQQQEPYRPPQPKRPFLTAHRCTTARHPIIPASSSVSTYPRPTAVAISHIVVATAYARGGRTSHNRCAHRASNAHLTAL
jgi:hypothetical protein